MLPANEWWGILEAYGAAVWPAQAVFYLAGLVLTGLLFQSRHPIYNLLTKLYLTLSFGWISLVFFLTLGRGLAGNVFFAALFLIISLLFALDCFRQRMDFRLPEAGPSRTMALGLTAVVWSYPLISLALGLPWAKTIIPGTFPCPTTALALVLLANALPRADKTLFILLLFWALPFAPFIQIPRYGIYEDVIMFATGIYGLVRLVKNWGRINSTPTAKTKAPSPNTQRGKDVGRGCAPLRPNRPV